MENNKMKKTELDESNLNSVSGGVKYGKPKAVFVPFDDSSEENMTPQNGNDSTEQVATAIRKRGCY